MDTDMKFLFLFIVLWLGGIPPVSAQWDFDDNPCAVPTEVKSAFQKKYPNAKEVFWVRYKDQYRASFFNKGLSHEIHYSDQGNWICACTYLDLKDLPQPAQDLIAQRFPNWEIPSVLLKMEQADHSISYRVHFEVPEGLLELIFSQEGYLTQEKMDIYQEED